MSEIVGLLMCTILLAAGVGAVGLAAWRGRRMPGRWDNLDVAIALLSLIWVAAGTTLALARWQMGTWSPGADLGILLALAGTAAGGVVATGIVLSRGSRVALGLGPVAWRQVGWGLLAVVPFVLFSMGWIALLETLGYAVEEQDLLGRVRGTDGGAAVAFSVLYGVLMAPVIEELLFRGFMIPPLQRVGGSALAIGMSAGLFALMHLSDVEAVPPIFVLGVVLAMFRIRTGSLWPSLALHIGNNAVAMGTVVLGWQL